MVMLAIVIHVFSVEPLTVNRYRCESETHFAGNWPRMPCRDEGGHSTNENKTDGTRGRDNQHITKLIAWNTDVLVQNASIYRMARGTHTHTMPQKANTTPDGKITTNSRVKSTLRSLLSAVWAVSW